MSYRMVPNGFPADAEFIGQYVNVRYPAVESPGYSPGCCGQGGTLTETTPDAVFVTNPLGDEIRFERGDIFEIELCDSDGDPVLDVECMESHTGQCSGKVQYHSVDPGRAKAWPRCQKHWSERLRRREGSLERYEHSDVAPSWFDPTAAGERWDDEY